MAAELTDENVPMNCGECDLLVEGIPQMIEHILDAHPNYSIDDAADFARNWADDSYESIELENIRLTEEYRRNHPRG
jgi:hypothetical protein